MFVWERRSFSCHRQTWYEWYQGLIKFRLIHDFSCLLIRIFNYTCLYIYHRSVKHWMLPQCFIVCIFCYVCKTRPSLEEQYPKTAPFYTEWIKGSLFTYYCWLNVCNILWWTKEHIIPFLCVYFSQNHYDCIKTKIINPALLFPLLSVIILFILFASWLNERAMDRVHLRV